MLSLRTAFDAARIVIFVIIAYPLIEEIIVTPIEEWKERNMTTTPREVFYNHLETHYRQTVALEDIHEEDWKLLDPDTQQEIVGFLRAELDDEIKNEVKKAYKKYGVEWMEHIGEDLMSPEEYAFFNFHFGPGMAIRNLLRDLIKDEDLPTDTWDELYVPALLRACDCR